MKDLGKESKILGMSIVRDIYQCTIYLNQEAYLKKVISRYNMNESKYVSTPLRQHLKLSASQSPENVLDKQKMENIPYASGVGSLMYSMVCTRPDLAYSMSVVLIFMANPGIYHWEALKWIMRYVNRTSEYGLMFRRQSEGENPVRGYVDSDFAGNIDTRKSITGYVFKLYGTAITWKSNLQSVVALSTTEAEYIASTEAVKEAKWLRGLMIELGINQTK
ncbi:secreted RxLR effector protein 161-like [Henckelia pumila]|uniref:secreted RxLR effector protein 161-like n=1 Tax=Henckelia pumila TaxID=405737 RepID=UPI003C6E599E